MRLPPLFAAIAVAGFALVGGSMTASAAPIGAAVQAAVQLGAAQADVIEIGRRGYRRGYYGNRRYGGRRGYRRGYYGGRRYGGYRRGYRRGYGGPGITLRFGSGRGYRY